MHSLFFLICFLSVCCYVCKTKRNKSNVIPSTPGTILKWTGIDCQYLNNGTEWLNYEICRLKPIRWEYSELTISVHLLKPITNLSATVQVFKRLSGYRPFLYNLKFDCCRLLASLRYPVSLEKFLFNVIKSHTNVNHSCPYFEPRVTLKDFGFRHEIFPLPIPDGTYRMDVNVSVFANPVAWFRFYVSKTEN